MARIVSSSGLSRRSRPRISAPICVLRGTTSNFVAVIAGMAAPSFARRSVVKQRAGRSVGAPVEHGLVSLILIGKLNGLVLTWREVHVAEHLAAAWTLAFHMNHEGGAFAFLAEDRAQAEEGIDVVARNLHA